MKNKEITVYELIGLIKDDKAPKKIICMGDIFEYDEKKKDYVTIAEIERGIKGLLFSVSKDLLFERLNEKVEILPEENDEWEDIYILGDCEEHHFMNRENNMTEEDRRLLDGNFKLLGETINQLIKNQKYLKERLDKDEKD